MQAIGLLVVAAGAVAVVVAAVGHPTAGQETAGIGLAAVMTGLMVLLLGNYLRHAAGRTGPDRGSGQPNSVPTTDTNDTISPG